MALTVIKAGLQTTLQGAPHIGRRHLGMPAAGAADSLSLALANQLVGNPADELALELTLDKAEFAANADLQIALTGAATEIRINNEPYESHRSLVVGPGDRIAIGAARHGCRSYLAIGGSFDAEPAGDKGSTYMPARIGGYLGRALAAGDEVAWNPPADPVTGIARTPAELRPQMTDQFLLRVTAAPESQVAEGSVFEALLNEKWQISHRSSRMGLSLEGEPLDVDDAASMKSAAVFPGTVQCPPDGKPYLLGPDAQTTGGYPRIAQVIRADRHLIGQLRPGTELQFVATSPERASEIYREKVSRLSPWIVEVSLW